jgi:hypothetical protein
MQHILNPKNDIGIPDRWLHATETNTKHTMHSMQQKTHKCNIAAYHMRHTTYITQAARLAVRPCNVRRATQRADSESNNAERAKPSQSHPPGEMMISPASWSHS